MKLVKPFSHEIPLTTEPVGEVNSYLIFDIGSWVLSSTHLQEQNSFEKHHQALVKMGVLVPENYFPPP